MPHGLANAVMLAARRPLQRRRPALYEPLARIGAALGDEADPAGAVDRAAASGSGCRPACPTVGVTDDDLDAVARAGRVERPACKANPRPVSEDEAREILEAAF